jgi:hypothetical protein
MLSICLIVPALQTLVIGGGPNPQYNQVAIESNVRYIGKIVQPNAPFRVLFADGSLNTKSVQYLSEKPVGEERVGPFTTGGTRHLYREPQLPRLDGAAILDNVRNEIAALGEQSNSPAFIYFTGHGSIAQDLKVSQFDLWSRQRFAVPDLISSLKAYPKSKKVTLLMVQCHSSDFANVLYQNGDPRQGLADLRICGFFASISARPAAGCTPAVNEEFYKDFSSYFLAALTGRDRVGRPVEGADFDHNGKIGMNEAFCWSLVNDDSIDTPVCTSDVFLKTAVQMSDADVFRTTYSDALKWSNPAQKAALIGLSEKLGLEGDDRLGTAFEKYGKIGTDEEKPKPIMGFRFVSLARSVVLGHALKSTPDKTIRNRFDELTKDESSNPLQP